MQLRKAFAESAATQVAVFLERGDQKTVALALQRMREYDPFAGRWLELPPFSARPIGEREFEIVDGEWRGDRFGFPRDGFVCTGTVAERVE